MQVSAICFSILLQISLTAAPITNSKISFEQFVQKRFSNCSVTKESLYLTKAQLSVTKKLSQVDGQNSLGLRFKLKCPKRELFAYVDSHIVRTLGETLVVFIEKNKINRIEMMTFLEPPEYKPSTKWMDQFKQKELSPKLKVYDEIDGLSGATLSAKAISYSARRILALHQVIEK